jgi:hypothetical protein
MAWDVGRGAGPQSGAFHGDGMFDRGGDAIDCVAYSLVWLNVGSYDSRSHRNHKVSTTAAFSGQEGVTAEA